VLDPSALKEFHPLVATPCYGGTLCINYAGGVLRLQGAAVEADMALDFHLRRGDSLVTRCRNDCVAYFLANPQFTHLFFIDADIGFSPEAAFRLLRCDRDVAGGVYPLKRDDWPAAGVPQGTTRERFDAYVDANSNLSHQGERLYTGDFGATLKSALPTAVGAPKGLRMRITGLENLKPSPG
jgi:hypothetical protein